MLNPNRKSRKMIVKPVNDSKKNTHHILLKQKMAGNPEKSPAILYIFRQTYLTD